MTPKISIIIPSYNSGEYLPFTLQSIEQQDYSNYEVILVDGESTDETPDVVKKLIMLLRHIFLKRTRDNPTLSIKVSHTRQVILLYGKTRTIFSCRGPFRHLSTIYNSTNAYDVYFGDIAFLGKDGRELWRRYFTGIDSLIANYHGLICNNQAAFIRRAVLDRYGFLDKSFDYAMDREFFLRLYRHRVKFKHFDHVVAGFRHQPNSKTDTPENVEKWAYEHARIAQQYNLFPPESPINKVLEKLGSFDKALRMFFFSPRRFTAMTRRTIFASKKRPY